jgi:acyl carrier protein
VELATRIKGLIENTIGVEAEEIQESDDLVNDLGCDSLDLLELVFAFEQAFEIEIPDQDAEKCRTVQDVIEYIDKRTAH